MAHERDEDFLRELPIEALSGVGPVTAKKLRAIGIERLLDVRAAEDERLHRAVGSLAGWLKQLSRGEDPRPVEPDQRRKSLSDETTYPEDLVDLQQIRGEIERIARHTAEGLAKRKLRARTVTIKVRYADFTTVTRSHTAAAPTCDAADIAARALALLERTAGGRHAMGAKAFATDGILIDIRKLDRVLGFDMERGQIEVEAGMQWPKLLAELTSAQRGRAKQWGFVQKQTGADRLSMGGCLSANVHGRGLTLPPFVGDVESFKLLDAEGDLKTCSRTENSELFSLAIGGYGLFGFIYSVTLRLVPRRKVERVVQVRDIAEIPAAFAGRIRDGFLYGDFQYSIDESSDGFLRRGVFSCYRPVPDSTPIPAARKELAEKDWTNLLLLAHTDKAGAFKRYAGYYLTTNGQVYWSDEHQMSIYPDYYHREIDRKLKTNATEAITEIYCERDALERFMVA